MAWRDLLLSRVGPGMLAGITWGDWVRVLRENRFAVSPGRVPRAMMIAWYAAQNSVMRRREERTYGAELAKTSVLPPTFVLGHWRHGTTHLPTLLTHDDRFAFPNTYQALFPHTFLSTEAIGARMMSFFMPERRPMDNVAWSMRSPQEDEFALCVLSGQSPLMGWVFPNHRRRYDRYLTLRDLSRRETAAAGYARQGSRDPFPAA